MPGLNRCRDRVVGRGYDLLDPRFATILKADVCERPGTCNNRRMPKSALKKSPTKQRTRAQRMRLKRSATALLTKGKKRVKAGGGSARPATPAEIAAREAVAKVMFNPATAAAARAAFIGRQQS